MQRANTAEGGTAGATVSIGNSGGAAGDAWSDVTIGTAASLVYDTATAAHGAVAYKYATGATAATAALTWTVPTAGRLYGRFCHRWGTALNVNQNLVRFRAGSTVQGRIGFTSGGKLAIFNAANTSVKTGTTTLTSSQWYRIEFDFTFAAAATAQVRLYADPDTTTITETITATSDFGTGADTVLFGLYTNTANYGPHHLDDLLVNDTGWPGPLTSADQVVSPAGVGSAAGLGSPVLTGLAPAGFRWGVRL